jgi:hypothetical protein
MTLERDSAPDFGGKKGKERVGLVRFTSTMAGLWKVGYYNMSLLRQRGLPTSRLKLYVVFKNAAGKNIHNHNHRVVWQCFCVMVGRTLERTFVQTKEMLDNEKIIMLRVSAHKWTTK